MNLVIVVDDDDDDDDDLIHVTAEWMWARPTKRVRKWKKFSSSQWADVCVPNDETVYMAAS